MGNLSNYYINLASGSLKSIITCLHLTSGGSSSETLYVLGVWLTTGYTLGTTVLLMIKINERIKMNDFIYSL